MTKKKAAKLVIAMVFIFFAATALFANPVDTLIVFLFTLLIFLTLMLVIG